MWYCVCFKIIWHDAKQHKIIEKTQVISFERVEDHGSYYLCFDGGECTMHIGKSQVIYVITE